MKPIVLISLGGSLVCPEGLDTVFLHKFREFVHRFRQNMRFILVIGGGGTNRTYVKAAKSLGVRKHDDLDWIGIAVTRLNAQLVRAVFANTAETTIQYDPHKKLPFTKQVLIAAGFRPGHSTDYDAVVLAKTYDVRKIINLTNVDYAYDVDPKKNKNAKKIEKITWPAFRKLVGTKWTPRLNMPFDPIASNLAHEMGVQVVIANGRNFKNLEAVLAGRKFKGTVIGS